MNCPKCGKKFGVWKEWINPFPRMFQSIRNEIKECKDCGVIVFRYKPEGNEERDDNRESYEE